MPVEHHILVPLPVELRGERVLLRPWRPGDGAELNAAVAPDVAYLDPWVPWAHSHGHLADSEAFARRAAADWLARKDLPLSLRLPDGTLAGGTGLHRFDWGTRRFEIGYWLRSSLQGRGLVTESVQLLTALCFEGLGASRVELFCDVRNERSAAIPRHLGFVLEGVLRRQLRMGAEPLRDVMCWSLLPEDWLALPWREAATAALDGVEWDPPRDA